ncbi:hypothetical protein AC578_2201 [Pseudocercospora eumusae]|uniref:Uncharacterized protein n=1 Tax=Pseudocercospora eumusae TaxID=321146 RepID=A0A139HAW4_9PEZI|nr:hypothetical protein AC578_2201 [Pseudocercospora eumusae]KXS99584.1 hypothetical protein AC578_2201 [Pseudocercospora eumusae]
MWKLLERAFDTQRVISGFVSQGGRFAKRQDIAQHQKFMSMENSGIWDGQTLRRAQIPQLWKLPTIRQRSQIILRNIEHMDRDVRLEGFNPEGRRLLRCGKNRIPWLWRTDMCPDESDYDEETIFAIFSARLRTMDKICDRNHTTEESPATLFLEAVAQWFETGGKVMTPFPGHATRFSIGRGVVQRRRAEDGGPVSISAGDRMQTGYTKLLPRDMATDYDIGRRTIVVESWAANKLRFDYPNLPDLLEKLRSYVLDIKDSCEWYDGLSDDIDDYSKIQLPMQKDQKSYQAAMRAQTSDADVEDDPDDEFDGDEDELYANEDEELDEEDALYAEHLREVDAMKAQSQAEPDVVSLEGKDEYSRLREAAKTLTCDGHSYVQERLKELSDLQSKFADDEQNVEEDIKQQNMARIEVIVAELEEYMQKLAGDEDSSTPKGPANTLTSTPDDQSSRAEIFQSHLAELKSINFFPRELETVLDAMNARMKEEEQFTSEEAFGMLWRLNGEFPITVGAS